MTHTETEIRQLAYRYFTGRPDDTTGLWRTMYAIEQQLCLAYDYSEPSMVEFLRDLNPSVAEAIAAQVEQLLDLADTVYHAEGAWGQQVFEMWRDEYVAQLRKVARLVRGIRGAPKRERHVLGASS